MARTLQPDEIARQLRDLTGWEGSTESLRRTLQAPDFPTAIKVVVEVAEVAEGMNHHPDIDIRYSTLHVTLSSHDAGGVTQLDVELAHRIDEVAREHGVT